MTYGAYVGGAFVLITLIRYFIGDFYTNQLQILSFIAITAGIQLGTTRFRDNMNGGAISYGKALGTGTLIAFWASLISGFFMYLLYSIIDPTLLTQYLDLMRAQLEEQIAADQVSSLIHFYEKLITPFIMALGEIIGKTLLGFIISLLLSIFIKRDPGIMNQPPSENKEHSDTKHIDY
jgi:hypothetical protein